MKHYTNVRLGPVMKGWFYSIAGLLFISGGFWLAVHYLTGQPDEFNMRYYMFESWLLKIHGGAAMASLMVLGVLIPTHMRYSWHQGRNRATAILLVGACILMILSGYGLYYFGGEALRSVMSGFHSILGCMLPFVLVGHILKGRKKKNGAPRAR
jgi:hypothetical protein